MIAQQTHNAAVWAMMQGEAGNIVLAGACGSPVSAGLFIFKDVTPADIEAFVESDPYVINGLVTKYDIKPYMVVVGDS